MITAPSSAIIAANRGQLLLWAMPAARRLANTCACARDVRCCSPHGFCSFACHTRAQKEAKTHPKWRIGASIPVPPAC